MEKIEKVESTGKMQLVDTRDLLIDNKDFFGEGLLDCYVVHPSIFGDSRGFFENSFDIGDEEFIDSLIKDENLVDNLPEEQQKVQDLFGLINKNNTSDSAKGTIRGMHYQEEPRCQTKLVRVTNGKAIDVVVDIRKDSPTFGKWFGALLTKENHRQLLVPKGFAHGFLALEDNTTFGYLVDEGYHKETENGIPWDDAGVNIDWETMFRQYGITNVLTSDKDKLHSTLEEKVANDELTFTVKSSRDTNRARLMKAFKAKKEEIEELKNENKELLSQINDLKKRLLNFENADKESKNMKIFVTGGAGQLGYDVIKELKNRGYNNIYAPTIAELDLTNKEAVDKAFEKEKPDLVIHCAAYTAVDKAEENYDAAYDINVNATSYISDNCKKLGSKLIYISTDYVFDGKKDTPYEVTDEPNPLSVYGKTKLLGERAALNNPKTFVVRTSWVFGINGKNFMRTMLNLAENHKELSVVGDQYGSPTYTVDLARLLVDMSETEKYGLYHANNEGYCNWAEFAEEIFSQNNKKVEVHHLSTEEYYAPQYEKAKAEGRELVVADRPKNSKLSKAKLDAKGFSRLPEWTNAVKRYSEELRLAKVLENNNKPKTL